MGLEPEESRLIFTRGRLVTFSCMDRFICSVTCVGAMVTSTGTAFPGMMNAVGRRMTSANIAACQCFRITFQSRMVFTTLPYKNPFQIKRNISEDAHQFLNGAGGGIRTHEGLRHRVLSPRQAFDRAFCPLDLALVPPHYCFSGAGFGSIRGELRLLP